MTEDTDPIETREWLDALDAVVRNSGEERAGWLEEVKTIVKERLANS